MELNEVPDGGNGGQMELNGVSDGANWGGKQSQMGGQTKPNMMISFFFKPK
jgi:hypothetical protein